MLPHLKANPIYGHHVVLLLLVVHLIIGHRRLQDLAYYRDDELVKGLLGLKRLPGVSTMSRSLKSADVRSVDNVRAESRTVVIERLVAEGFATITLDFDGSVLSTGRHAEGTAVGFNKKKKGARSYYPLFCTVAQTDQVLDVHHRPGNVHDSKGADAFIERCVCIVRASLPRARIEVRMDSAFFSRDIIDRLHSLGVTFTVSVPFERVAELKGMVQGRRQWWPMGMDSATSRAAGSPSPGTPAISLSSSETRPTPEQGRIQSDLFRPSAGYEFKVIVTNKRIRHARSPLFHEGRGSQEGIFAELKTHCQMGYVPVKTRVGNQLVHVASILAHNLTRELQDAESTPVSVRPQQNAPPVVLPRNSDFAVPSFTGRAYSFARRQTHPVDEHQSQNRSRDAACSRQSSRPAPDSQILPCFCNNRVDRKLRHQMYMLMLRWLTGEIYRTNPEELRAVEQWKASEGIQRVH